MFAGEECYPGSCNPHVFVNKALGARIEYVPVWHVLDYRIRTHKHNTTLESLKEYYWGKVVPLPDLVSCFVGLHDAIIMYESRSPVATTSHLGLEPTYHIDLAATGGYELIRHINATMANCAAYGGGYWLLAPTPNMLRQPNPTYRYTTSARRMMLVNAWARGLAVHHPTLTLIDHAAMSAFEYPEFNSDGVHSVHYHYALYHATRDIMYGDYCTRRGFSD